LRRVKKDGKRGYLQRYKCVGCGYVFENKRRQEKKVRERFWRQYVLGKQTYKQLSEQQDITLRTVQRKIDDIIVELNPIESGPTVIIMDTCYFGRGFGVMVFRDAYTSKNLYWKYVKYESIAEYVSGIEYLKERGCLIKAIVCDGKRGLFHAFGDIPVQMCQFHQVAIVRRYITRSPKLPAGKELKELVKLLTRTDRESFVGAITEWHQKWELFLKEKTYQQLNKRKWHYTHHRLRSAYNSLKYNLPYLFTWYDNPSLRIPNTTNSLEAIFSNLKNKIRIHAGLKKNRKQKFIDQILSK
jgi:hypothetical protein